MAYHLLVAIRKDFTDGQKLNIPCVCVCASKMNRRTKKQSDPHSLTHTKHTHFPSDGKIGKGTSENNFTRAGMLKRAADFGFSIRQTISPRVRWLE